MTTPYLQLALDCFELEDALKACDEIGHDVDILEAGTLLCAATGMEGLRAIRQRFPNKIIVTDLKITDASSNLCQLVFKNGTNWTTLNASADTSTMQTAVDIANSFNGEIQVELFGSYDEDKIKSWSDMGISQAIYHKPRERKGEWSLKDLEHIKWLNGLGMDVSVTGGITINNIHLFKGLSIKTFIIGRALLKAQNPTIEVKRFKEKIEKYWND